MKLNYALQYNLYGFSFFSNGKLIKLLHSNSWFNFEKFWSIDLLQICQELGFKKDIKNCWSNIHTDFVI